MHVKLRTRRAFFTSLMVVATVGAAGPALASGGPAPTATAPATGSTPASATGPIPAPSTGAHAPSTEVGPIPAVGAMNAAAAPQVQVCVPNSYCLNRDGGGTTKGTPIITYSFNDPNNDFTFVALISWCGNTGRVQVSPACPFTAGSGLNGRYAGDMIYELYSYNTGRNIYIPTFAPDANEALGNTGDQGYAFVASAVNSADYVISVGESNWAFGKYGTYNQPWWLVQNSFDTKTFVYPSALNAWSCQGTGIGSC